MGPGPKNFNILNYQGGLFYDLTLSDLCPPSQSQAKAMRPDTARWAQPSQAQLAPLCCHSPGPAAECLPWPPAGSMGLGRIAMSAPTQQETKKAVFLICTINHNLTFYNFPASDSWLLQ